MWHLVKGAYTNLKDVALWACGLWLGIVIALSDYYLTGLGIAAFCAFMTKLSIDDGVAINELMDERTRQERDAYLEERQRARKANSARSAVRDVE